MRHQCSDRRSSRKRKESWQATGCQLHGNSEIHTSCRLKPVNCQYRGMPDGRAGVCFGEQKVLCVRVRARMHFVTIIGNIRSSMQTCTAQNKFSHKHTDNVVDSKLIEEVLFTLRNRCNYHFKYFCCSVMGLCHCTGPTDIVMHTGGCLHFLLTKP